MREVHYIILSTSLRVVELTCGICAWETAWETLHPTLIVVCSSFNWGSLCMLELASGTSDVVTTTRYICVKLKTLEKALTGTSPTQVLHCSFIIN